MAKKYCKTKKGRKKGGREKRNGFVVAGYLMYDQIAGCETRKVGVEEVGGGR